MSLQRRKKAGKTPAAKQQQPARKKANKKAPITDELVQGVRLALVDPMQVGASLRALKLETGGDVRERTKRLAAYLLSRDPSDGSKEYDQCERCMGSQDLALTAPLLGEVCVFCGDGPGQAEAAEAKPPTATVSQLATVELEHVALAAIDMRASPPMRAALDPDAIERYAAILPELPPVELVRVGERLLIADGWHRVRAAERAGADTIAAVVRDGTVRDALLSALAANRGVRRTPDDLRVVVLAALADPAIGRWSDRRIAAHIGCADRTVGRVRAGMAKPEQPAPRVGADGRIRKPPEQQAEARKRIELERAQLAAQTAEQVPPDAVTLMVRADEQIVVPMKGAKQLRGEHVLNNCVVMNFQFKPSSEGGALRVSFARSRNRDRLPASQRGPRPGPGRVDNPRPAGELDRGRAQA